MCAKSLQLCPILCNPVDYSLQALLSMAGILEWVTMPFSRGSSWPKDLTQVSCIYPHWHVVSLPLVPPGKPAILEIYTRSRWYRHTNKPSYWLWLLFYLWLFKSWGCLWMCARANRLFCFDSFRFRESSSSLRKFPRLSQALPPLCLGFS